jgi:dTDP-4-amino-4,6-dideoxygalactose transaminase
MSGKRRVEDLAVLGGDPVFPERLHVGRPNIGDRERLLARINDLLDRRWLTNDGPYAQELERRLGDLLGVAHCVVMCNATLGLEITVRALGLTGEVIVPSFTFVATAHALQWQAITPVFCDVDPRTHMLAPDRVKALITPRTTGILGVHLWGRACDVDALTAIAARHRLALVFDAAHALGASHNGRMIGGFGAAEVFSFHATKFFNTFEGGAVTTNDDALAAKLRLMRNFGFSGYDQVVSLGTNAKMSEVAAAMGLTGLESLDVFIEANLRNYRHYRHELSDLPGFRFLTYDENEKSNYQYIVLEVEESVTGLHRDQLLKILWAENVLARRYFYPGCHRMEPYRAARAGGPLPLPVTEGLSERVLVLPTGTAVGPKEISAICEVIRFVLANAARVRALLES